LKNIYIKILTALFALALIACSSGSSDDADTSAGGNDTTVAEQDSSTAPAEDTAPSEEDVAVTEEDTGGSNQALDFEGDDERIFGELSLEEAQGFCEQVGTIQLQLFNDNKEAICSGLAASGDMGDNCEQGLNMCISMFGMMTGDMTSCENIEQDMQDCQATVGEMESCMSDMIDIISAHIDFLSTIDCSTDPADLEGVSTDIPSPPCMDDIEAKCPNFGADDEEDGNE
jgi:hypothetical protein